jgi:hypothetical protein
MTSYSYILTLIFMIILFLYVLSGFLLQLYVFFILHVSAYLSFLSFWAYFNTFYDKITYSILDIFCTTN